jgi:GTPase SAR1 family protein
LSLHLKAGSYLANSSSASLETRAHVTSHLGDDVTADDETEPILMEVRQRVKTSPGDDEEVEAPAQQNKSFASTHMAFQQMGQGLKAINDALGKLQTLGIQHVAHLPELVLVGDQSSGKSSLMSALANLNLPRSSSMCTRCPIHIRVSSGSRPWRCSVSLHKDYKLVGTTGDNLNMNNPPAGGSPYQGWRRMRQRDIQEFKTIEFTNDTVSADIERVIRWAQVAILNDHIDYHTYIPKISSEEGYNDNEVDMLENLDRFEGATLAKFSPNRVALEIRGPGLADMSFYDLPGVFSSRPNPDEQYLMKAVETLAAEYISHPSAIILWAVPMNIDPDNSVSFGLIQRANALNRCVAVLTKADLVPHTDHTPWIKFLKGETYRPGLGSHIIARPQRSDPDAYEESYFNRRTNAMNSNIGWPTDFAPFDDKCGVSRLKLTLSQKLGEEFSKM